MIGDPESLKNPSRRLPHLRLERVDGAGAVSVRGRHRHAPVLVLVHPSGCPGCEAYIAELRARAEEIEEWDGDVIAVIDRTDPTGAPMAGAPPVLIDSDSRLAERLGVSAPAVVIADQWGVIRAVDKAGDGHTFLAVDEIVQWVRFLAIECPECEGEVF